jgi:hypothetical protein
MYFSTSFGANFLSSVVNNWMLPRRTFLSKI